MSAESERRRSMLVTNRLRPRRVTLASLNRVFRLRKLRARVFFSSFCTRQRTQRNVTVTVSYGSACMCVCMCISRTSRSLSFSLSPIRLAYISDKNTSFPTSHRRPICHPALFFLSLFFSLASRSRAFANAYRKERIACRRGM